PSQLPGGFGEILDRLLVDRTWLHLISGMHGAGRASGAPKVERLAANLLRLTQVATGRVVPLTGLLSLFDLVVVAEVEPLQTSARITHLEIGRVAIVSRYDVVGDVAELSAVGSVEGTAQFGLPLERCLMH